MPASHTGRQDKRRQVTIHEVTRSNTKPANLFVSFRVYTWIVPILFCVPPGITDNREGSQWTAAFSLR